MMLCGCVVGQKGWASGDSEKWSRWGRGGVEEEGMAFVASEADRSLAEVSIAVLVVCLLTN